MCGIAGHVERGANARLGALTAGSLAHRGPDADGQRSSSGPNWSWTLLHTRLSVVDLSSAGNQPMENEDRSLSMVFNGEIYNSPELRRYCEAHGHRFRSSMDGEVILHLWEMEGVAGLARLNGIFAVAVANTVTGEVVLARDPLGVKPLFYSADGRGSLWFASEPAALEAAGAPTGGPDLVALAQFLTFLWVPSPRSPRSGVRSLEPGRVLRWTPEGTEEVGYAAPLHPTPGPSPVARAVVVDQARQHLRDAANRQLLADVPVGLMASGGVDSALLWWAARHGLERAYTIRWDTGDDREHLDDDYRAVSELAQRWGTPVDYLAGERSEDVLPASGDLFADPAFGLTQLIARSARTRGRKVLLSGQGGDELFGGYRRHRVAPLLGLLTSRKIRIGLDQLLRRVPSQRLSAEYVARLAKAATERDAFRGYMQLCSYSTANERARALDCTESEVGDDVVWQQHQRAYEALPGGLSFLRRVMAVDLAVYLPGLGLAYADRAGMEFGVEVRVPWLDLELVRWSLQLPDEALMRWGRGKWLPRRLAEDLISHQIANRPKRGFAAPASRIEQEIGHGARGFRQGAYFARARRLLDQYLGRHTEAA